MVVHEFKSVGKWSQNVCVSRHELQLWEIPGLHHMWWLMISTPFFLLSPFSQRNKGTGVFISVIHVRVCVWVCECVHKGAWERERVCVRVCVCVYNTYYTHPIYRSPTWNKVLIMSDSYNYIGKKLRIRIRVSIHMSIDHTMCTKERLMPLYSICKHVPQNRSKPHHMCCSCISVSLWCGGCLASGRAHK